MSSLERLPPDQRAVLALVLQRGRTYDEIANLLAIDRAAVRDRALAAMDALGPSEPRLAPERRALITDYLLGQLPPKVRDQTGELLARSPSERAWARVLASELAPMSRTPLPEIPSGTSAPAPEPEPDPAAPEAAATPAATPEPSATPALAGAPEAAGPSGAGAPTTPPLGSDRPLPRPVPVERPRSRGGGGVLLAIAALIVVVVVIVILVTNSGSSPKKTSNRTVPTPTKTSTTTTGTNTTTTSKGEHIIAEIELKPTTKASKAVGLADIVTEGKVTFVVVGAEHLTPNAAHNAYAVWLSNPGGPSKLLGYVDPGVGKDGDLKTSGKLPSNAGSYKEILVALETTTNTTTPGPTILSGTL